MHFRLRRDSAAIENHASSARIAVPSLVRQDTSTTYTLDDDPSAGEVHLTKIAVDENLISLSSIFP